MEADGVIMSWEKLKNISRSTMLYHLLLKHEHTADPLCAPHDHNLKPIRC